MKAKDTLILGVGLLGRLSGSHIRVVKQSSEKQTRKALVGIPKSKAKLLQESNTDTFVTKFRVASSCPNTAHPDIAPVRDKMFPTGIICAIPNRYKARPRRIDYTCLCSSCRATYPGMVFA